MAEKGIILTFPMELRSPTDSIHCIYHILISTNTITSDEIEYPFSRFFQTIIFFLLSWSRMSVGGLGQSY